MKMRRSILALVLGGLTSANAQILVDVNFDDAVVGQPPPLLYSTPTSSLPSHLLDSMNFGQLIVVDAIGGMSRAVKFSGEGYCQTQVFASEPPSITRFGFEFDFLLSNFSTRGPQYNSVDEFAVLFDMPQTVRINFQSTGAGNGRISVGAGGTTLGSFTFDTTHHLTVSVDLVQQRWSASLDNALIFSQSAPFFQSLGSALGGVRLHRDNDGLLANDPLAYVDNIRLTAVPEPATGGLLLLGGLGWCGRKRFRSTIGK